MKQIVPGIYLLDNNETISVNVPEILKELGVSDTPVARKVISNHFQNVFKGMFPHAAGKVITDDGVALHPAPEGEKHES